MKFPYEIWLSHNGGIAKRVSRHHDLASARDALGHKTNKSQRLNIVPSRWESLFFELRDVATDTVIEFSEVAEVGVSKNG